MSNLSAIFVTMATLKFNKMPKFYTSVILLINQSKELCEKQISVLALEGAKLVPLLPNVFKLEIMTFNTVEAKVIILT